MTEQVSESLINEVVEFAGLGLIKQQYGQAMFSSLLNTLRRPGEIEKMLDIDAHPEWLWQFSEDEIKRIVAQMRPYHDLDKDQQKLPENQAFIRDLRQQCVVIHTFRIRLVQAMNHRPTPMPHHEDMLTTGKKPYKAQIVCTTPAG